MQEGDGTNLIWYSCKLSLGSNLGKYSSNKRMEGKWPSWFVLSLSLANGVTALNILWERNKRPSHMPAWPAFGPASPLTGCRLCPQAGQVTSLYSPCHGRRQDPGWTTALLLDFVPPSPTLFKNGPLVKSCLDFISLRKNSSLFMDFNCYGDLMRIRGDFMQTVYIFHSFAYDFCNITLYDSKSITAFICWDIFL